MKLQYCSLWRFPRAETKRKYFFHHRGVSPKSKHCHDKFLSQIPLMQKKLLHYQRKQMQFFFVIKHHWGRSKVKRVSSGNTHINHVVIRASPYWCYCSEVEKWLAICCWCWTLFYMKTDSFQAPCSSSHGAENGEWQLPTSSCSYSLERLTVTTTTCGWKALDWQSCLWLVGVLHLS